MKTFFALIVSVLVSLGFLASPFTRPPNPNPVRVMHIETQEAIATPTTQAFTETPSAAQVILIQSGPPCEIDWSLPVTSENLQAILACHKLRNPFVQGRGIMIRWDGGPAENLCPPPFSEWESVFNTSNCWAINHGTPAALTETALPQNPTSTPLMGYPSP